MTYLTVERRKWSRVASERACKGCSLPVAGGQGWTRSTERTLVEMMGTLYKLSRTGLRAMAEAYPGRVGRRLAAIVAADVAGYSRLMGLDEVGTARTLREHRKVTDALVAKHGDAS